MCSDQLQLFILLIVNFIDYMINRSVEYRTWTQKTSLSTAVAESVCGTL